MPTEPDDPRPKETLAAAITRSVLWLSATMVVAMAALIEYRRVADSRVSDAATALTIGHILAAQVDRQDRLSWPQTCDRLISSSAVPAAYIVQTTDAPQPDAQGKVLHAARRYSDLDGVVANRPLSIGRSKPIDLAAGVDRPPMRVHLVDLPLGGVTVSRGPGPTSANSDDRAEPPAYVARVLVRLERPAEPWTAKLWLWGVPLLAIGTVGSVLGVLRIRRHVVAPLSVLKELVREGPVAVTTEATERDDEIGQIARAMVSLHADRNEWRNRAEQFSRTVDAKVAQRTQSILTELRRAQRESTIDPLTRLSNRRVLQERFGAIFDAQREAGQDLTVVMLDVDHFKTLNDNLGHVCGDELLKFAADLIRGAMRADDLAVRYGGDEFMLVLPSVSASDAEAIARRIVALFAQRTKLLPKVKKQPTLSAGVASLWTHGPGNADELIALADQALYAAKTDGRNGVGVAMRMRRV